MLCYYPPGVGILFDCTWSCEGGKGQGLASGLAESTLAVSGVKNGVTLSMSCHSLLA